MTIEGIATGYAAASLSALRTPQQTVEPPGKAQVKVTESSQRGTEKTGNSEPLPLPRLDEKVLEQIERELDLSSVSREYKVIDKLGKVYIRLYDKDTGDMIREFPAEKLLKIAKALDAVSGALFEGVV